MRKLYNYLITKLAYYWFVGKNNKNIHNFQKANDFCLKYKVYN